MFLGIPIDPVPSVSCYFLLVFYIVGNQYQTLRLHHIIDHLYKIFLENDGSENYAQLLEEEVNKMFDTNYLNYEHDCNIVGKLFEYP